jgi:hypothetical protein
MGHRISHARIARYRSPVAHELPIALALVLAVAACGEPSSAPDGDGGQTNSTACVQGSGTHRLFIQGHGGVAFEDGSYPMLHEIEPGDDDAVLCDDSVFVIDENDDGIWQPGETPRGLGPKALVHGEHFLVGTGSFAEFRAELCADITGDITFYIPNFDVEGSNALHQLFVVHEGQEQLIAEAIDDEAGQSGYNPFVRVIAGTDPDAVAGDQLLLRSTNLNGLTFSVMVWQPPSEYESWIQVTVP